MALNGRCENRRWRPRPTEKSHASFANQMVNVARRMTKNSKYKIQYWAKWHERLESSPSMSPFWLYVIELNKMRLKFRFGPHHLDCSNPNEPHLVFFHLQSEWSFWLACWIMRLINGYIYRNHTNRTNTKIPLILLFPVRKRRKANQPWPATTPINICNTYTANNVGYVHELITPHARKKHKIQ